MTDQTQPQGQQAPQETLGAQNNGMLDNGQLNRGSDAPVQGGAPQAQGGQQGQGTLRDPDDWATGDEPMTDAQRSYLDTLATEAGEELPATLTKAEASKHIDRLQGASPRTAGAQGQQGQAQQGETLGQPGGQQGQTLGQQGQPVDAQGDTL